MPRYNVKLVTGDYHHECEVECDGDHADAISEARKQLNVTADVKSQSAEIISYELPEPEPYSEPAMAAQPEPEAPEPEDPTPPTEAA